MKDLRDYTYDGLKDLVERFGERPYRARQLHAWLFRDGVESIDEMTDLPKDFRRRLRDGGFYIGVVEVLKTRRSVDGTVKLLLGLEDGSGVECVLIPDGKRLTLCVSTQCGCSLGCRFCMTGGIGPGRNLRLSEMTAEVLAASSLVGSGLIEGYGRITNVVLMGMGEPLLNYDEVLRFITVLTDPKAMGFSTRRVTVSTAGVVPAIKRLGRDADINLAVSLNATTDVVRDRLMPINRRHPLKELLAALRSYPLRKGRRITMEYVLIKGVNDSRDDAYRLVRLLKGIPCKINLIPFNPFPGCGFERPGHERVETFWRILSDNHYSVVTRASRGMDIEAACGQLQGKRGL